MTLKKDFRIRLRDDFHGYQESPDVTAASTTFLQTGSLSFTLPFRSGNLGVECEGVGVVCGAYTLGKAHREWRCVGAGSSPSSFP